MSKLHRATIGTLVFGICFLSSYKAYADMCTKCSGLGHYFKGFSVVQCDKCNGTGHVNQALADQLGVDKGMGYQTNKFDLKSRVETDGWVAAWGQDVSETDAAEGVVAAGVSVFGANPEAFPLWVDQLVDRTLTSLGNDARERFTAEAYKQVQGLAREAIATAIRGKSANEVLRNYDTIDFKAGAIQYSGRNYIGSVNVSRTWGLKPYVAFRVRGSAKKNTGPVSSEKGANLRYHSFGVPYINANFNNAVVIDISDYFEKPEGRWIKKGYTRLASNGDVVYHSPVKNYVEQSRGPGGIVLKDIDNPNGVPTKLSNQGVYLYRTYPESPTPVGINPNQQAWWHVSNGQFVPN